MGNTALLLGNRHYNGKDYSSCFNKKSGETCTSVCMAGFSEIKSAGAGFPVVVNSFGQMLVSKQDFATYPDHVNTGPGGSDELTGYRAYGVSGTDAACGTWDNQNAVRRRRLADDVGGAHVRRQQGDQRRRLYFVLHLRRDDLDVDV